MQAAEAGDPEAQTNVGDIYERGLGVAPNYEAAAQWYQKAADKGYSRALFNLGTLYEQGTGVPHDQLKALNLYRQAWGLAEDNIIFASAAQREQEALRIELQKAVAEKDTQLGLLQKQLKELHDKLSKQPAPQQSREGKGRRASRVRPSSCARRLRCRAFLL
jgi:TPR repeat protein